MASDKGNLHGTPLDPVADGIFVIAGTPFVEEGSAAWLLGTDIHTLSGIVDDLVADGSLIPGDVVLRTTVSGDMVSTVPHYSLAALIGAAADVRTPESEEFRKRMSELVESAVSTVSSASEIEGDELE